MWSCNVTRAAGWPWWERPRKPGCATANGPRPIGGMWMGIGACTARRVALPGVLRDRGPAAWGGLGDGLTTGPVLRANVYQAELGVPRFRCGRLDAADEPTPVAQTADRPDRPPTCGSAPAAPPGTLLEGVPPPPGGSSSSRPGARRIGVVAAAPGPCLRSGAAPFRRSPRHRSSWNTPRSRAEVLARGARGGFRLVYLRQRPESGSQLERCREPSRPDYRFSSEALARHPRA